MKKGIHPTYAPVVFRDRSGGLLLITRSTATSDDAVDVDGTSYPVGLGALNVIGAIVVVIPVVFAAAYFDSRDVPGTPGKRVLGLAVLSPTGRPAFPCALLRDSLKIGLPWLIGHAAAFALAASSETIGSDQIGVWILTGAAYAVPTIWVASLFSPSGRTVYDRLSRTGVHRRSELSA